MNNLSVKKFLYIGEQGHSRTVCPSPALNNMYLSLAILYNPVKSIDIQQDLGGQGYKATRGFCNAAKNFNLFYFAFGQYRKISSDKEKISLFFQDSF